MIPSKLFQSTTKQEKIDFFVHAQEILIAHHPNSEFTFREDNLKTRMTYVRQMVAQYQGLCYMDDNINVLFNYVKMVEDDPIKTLAASMFKPPADPYDAVSIDMVIFKRLKDCADWVRARYDPQIKYIIYVKNGKPQKYSTADLISRVLKIPKAV